MKVKVYNHCRDKSMYTGKLHQWSLDYDDDMPFAVGIIEKSDGFFEAVSVHRIKTVSIEDQIIDLEKEIKRLSMINSIPLSEDQRVKIDEEYIEAVKELLRIRKELGKE